VDKCDEVPLQINGWRIYAHPLFLDQLNALINEVETLRRKDPQGYRSKNPSKRLAAIARLMLHDIPQDPARKEPHWALRTGIGAGPSSSSNTACSSAFTLAPG
jgi:hypothetical protein